MNRKNVSVRMCTDMTLKRNLEVLTMANMCQNYDLLERGAVYCGRW